MTQFQASEFPKMVEALAKPGSAILASLSAFKCDLFHMSDALHIEAGELADAVKRHVIYEKDLDVPYKEGQTLRENIAEELGDMEFYMERVRQLLGLDRATIIQQNVNKLSVRYASGSFSNNSANNRADKPVEVPQPTPTEPNPVSLNNGRRFMGGTESTLAGEIYLQPITSNDPDSANVGQIQLEELFRLSSGAIIDEVVSQQLETFKRNNGIRFLNGSVSEDMDLQQKFTFNLLIISYSNGSIFRYMKRHDKGSIWILGSVDGAK